MRRGAYLVPSLFTAANMFCGYFALMEAFKGGLRAETAAPHLDAAAKAIGFAFVFDGLDGRLARLMRTTSDFGRELDSLADVITFGVAPAVLAFVWGIRFLDPNSGALLTHVIRAGWFLSFLFLVCGAARLARFNITTNPIPANPGRPDRKYFVGLPIPAGALLVAAVVHVLDGEPLFWPGWAIAWLPVFMATSLLMVSRWRYNSFKEVDLLRRRRFASVVLISVLLAAIWFYSEPVLLAMAVIYVGSGVVTRIASALRRRLRPVPPHTDVPAES